MAVVLPTSGSYGLINPQIKNRYMFSYHFTGLNLTQGGGGEDTDLQLDISPADRNPRGLFNSIRMAVSAQAQIIDVALRTTSGLGSLRNTYQQLFLWEGITEGWFAASYDGMHIPFQTEHNGILYLTVKNVGNVGAIQQAWVTIVIDIDSEEMRMTQGKYSVLV